jgi:small subunit ribosomal protein S3Ae
VLARLSHLTLHTMAIGKNKGLNKKKAGRKKAVDPMTRKDWYDIKVPAIFANRIAGKTCVNKTHGQKTSSASLMGRVFEVCLADLNSDEEQCFRKMKLRVEDVQGSVVVTNFHGMSFTRDKICSLIKKWQTLIEANVDISTTDGYKLRLFCIGFTKKQDNQEKKTCYAQSSQIRAIRKKMVSIMAEEASKGDLRELMQKLIPGAIGKDIEKQVQQIFPMKDVYVFKAKMLKRPKFDLTKLMEVHTAAEGDASLKVDREEKRTVAGSGGRY